AGPEGAAFATGDAFDAEACGITGEDDALPRAYASGARPGCASGWGVLDLGGNVSELVADRMPVSFLDGRGFPWLRGANWSTGEASARCAARDHFHYGSLNGNEAFHNDGFRCCADRAVADRKAEPIATAPAGEPREDWLRHKGLFMHIRDKSLSAEVRAMIAGLAPAADPRAGMAEVPEGPFPMGSFRTDPDRSEIEWRTHAVRVPTFWIDLYEFPNRKGEKPVTGVTWYESRALCEAVGKRLCTEEEWEKACKGTEGSAYPYGHAFDPEVCDGGRAPYDLEDKAPSGSKPGCDSGYGVFDLSGSVNEWTASGYGVAYSDETYRMLRGGDWGGSRRDLRCASRNHYHDPTQWY
ncbi:MAG: SUMF1/EgtB/PvdO family nonheme iron enzyme, partial [Candidatus Methylomirabilis sp.]|nr:SUMF1/EgtB/PvdO family nonheme iron enzyme [Deltaproteobacteria bacterium]